MLAFQISYDGHEALSELPDQSTNDADFIKQFSDRLAYLKQHPQSDFDLIYQDFIALNNQLFTMIHLNVSNQGLVISRGADDAPLPPFSESSKSWTNHLLSTAQDLAQHCKMSLYEALNLPVSFEAFFYSSDAWEKRKLELEAEAQKHNALIKIGNEVIKAITNLGGRKR